MRSTLTALGWAALLAAAIAGGAARAAEPKEAPGTPPAASPQAEPGSRPKRVFVIPIRTEIGEPVLYLLRRGLKEAVAAHADAVVLDVNTPGGAVDVTMQILDDLKRFPGRTIAFVDNEAMSAGAFICTVCDEIWFATTPTEGIIGAAAPVQSTGQDIDATMKEKLVSYLKVRIRSISEGKGHRGEVVSAMIDADMELKIDGQEVKIDGKAIKEKGSLLSLTATEAMHKVGTPPEPLLGAGLAKDLDDLIAKRFGPSAIVTRMQATWSEGLAVHLNHLAPILLGLGMVCLLIGFKSQGYGGFIAVGVVLLTIVFLSSFVAGLSGHEPVIVFSIGLVLLLLEILFFTAQAFSASWAFFSWWAPSFGRWPTSGPESRSRSPGRRMRL